MECSKFSCNGFNGSFFQKNELGTLETVAGKCVQMTTSEIISASHKEPAWMNNHHSMAAGPGFAITGMVVQDDGARFRKMLSEYVLPEALQRTCPSLRTSVQPGSTGFCETLLPNGLNIRMQLFIRIIDKVL